MTNGTLKSIALLAGFTLFSSLAVAQTQKEPAPGRQAETAAPAGAGKDASKPVPSAKHSRRDEDARHCLDLPSNQAIIKCAEAYL